MLEGGNPNVRHHGKGLKRATFCHGVELSYCLVTVRALTETVGFTNNCIHQSHGDAIGLENLKHISPVNRIKGFSEVNESSYCQQVSGSDPFIDFS